MFLSDLPTILFWWLVVTVFTLPGFFVGKKVFEKFPDSGYPFFKILGIAIVSYLVWICGSLHLIAFSRNFVIVTFAVVTTISLGAAFFFKTKITINKKIVLLEELLFLAGLILWSFIRAHNPEIHGLEKFMDMSLVNASLKTSYFPPMDPWLSGSTVNYYYYGHFITALLTKLSGLSSYIIYNLMIATIFGLTLSGAFSLGFNIFSLIQKQRNKILVPIIVGLLAGLLVTLGGNLHTIYAFTTGYPISDNNDGVKPPWKLLGAPNPGAYWYPSAVRMIPYTIHEIPSYSFVVSDLHAHLLDIPFALTVIALLLSLFLENLIALFVIPVILATLYMTNSLDALIYSGLIFIINTYRTIKKGYINSSLFITFTVLSITATVVLVIPFVIHFVPFVNGIGVNCPLFSGQLGPIFFDAEKCQHSPLYMLTILWGFPIFTIGCFGVWLKKNRIEINQLDIFVLLMSLLSIVLIVFPEFFYFKDIYPMHFRANTMFKLGYQAYIMFSISIAYILFRIRIANILLRLSFYALCLIQLILVVIYPYFAVNSYYQNLQTYQKIDGSNFLQTSYPDDYIAIKWVRDNVTEQEIILEASGESYSDYARVSSFTGLSTVIGWPGHEWGWRKSGDEAYKRKGEVQAFYEAQEKKDAENILKKYKVKYIFVGQLEKSTYSKLNLDMIKSLSREVFKSGETTVFKVN